MGSLSLVLVFCSVVHTVTCNLEFELY